MAQKLNGKRVAVLVENGFEQIELTSPIEALREAGAEVDIVSPQKSKVRGWQHDHWGDSFDVDQHLEGADAENYDALVLPGGVMNPDALRRNTDATTFVQSFFKASKPVASICHGPWTLIDAGVVKGRRMTSYHTIQTDLKNAGANWLDEEVVVDEGLVTSRNPDDLEAFNSKMVEGRHAGQHA